VRRFHIVNIFSGKWDLEWYIQQVAGTNYGLVDTPLNTTSAGDNQTIAEQYFGVEPGGDTFRERFVEKTPGLFGFDYSLTQYCTPGADPIYSECTLPPNQAACGVGGFEAISLFCMCILFGILTTVCVHDPFHKWYNKTFLSKDKGKKEKLPFLYGPLSLEEVRSSTSDVLERLSAVKELWATTRFSDTPKEIAATSTKNLLASVKKVDGATAKVAQMSSKA